MRRIWQRITQLRLPIAVVLALLLAMLTTAPARGQALSSDSSIKVVLHKLLFARGQLPAATQNDGRDSPFGDDGAPLRNVTFTVYDATADFWGLQPTTPEAMVTAQRQIAAASYAPGQALAAVTTDAAGQAAFNLPQRRNGQNAVYLFRETAHPANVAGGQNLVLVLPVKGLTNRVDLYPKNEEVYVPRTTGGQRFVKVDGDTGDKLADAEFVVRSGSGKYLHRTAGKNQWQSISGEITEQYEDAQLTVLRSDSSGRFAIDGLQAGKYALVEVRAPYGYVRSDHAVPFTIQAGKFSDATNFMRVVNVQEPYPPLPDTGFFGKIKHYWHKVTGLLPQTGGARNTVLTLLGMLIFLVSALAIYYERKHNAREKNNEAE